VIQKKSDIFFKYPGNLKTLDLATMVQLYRMRGEPYEAEPGEILACSYSHRLLKSAKKWFGLYYSQKSWDKLLTSNADGYPLTDVELNILGLFSAPPVENLDRKFVEDNSYVLPQLAFLIINDLKQFGFLEELDDPQYLQLTGRGVKALDGIARRIYGKKFMPEMLEYYRENGLPNENNDDKQIPLF